MAETSVLQQAKQNTITDFVGRLYVPLKRVLKNCKLSLKMSTIDCIKVVSSEFYFHKPITVHIELYLFYRFIHFLLYIGQY